ncbi:MAG TPA: hypothetical protein VK826_15730, partial [Bacteroidia bacterium]|nr:hypothetical protein [Bacteroidia bacterium]
MRTILKTLAIVVLAVLFTNKLSAQQDVELVNSAEIMAEGNFYYSIGKYSKAANLYKKVGRNDTNYAEVLLDLCVAYNEDKEDSLCLISARKGIELESRVRGDFYNLAGISLREMKKYDEG